MSGRGSKRSAGPEGGVGRKGAASVGHSRAMSTEDDEKTTKRGSVKKGSEKVRRPLFGLRGAGAGTTIRWCPGVLPTFGTPGFSAGWRSADDSALTRQVA